MKVLWIDFCVVFASILFFALPKQMRLQSGEHPVAVRPAISLCGTSVENLQAMPGGKFISILPGWGSHSYKINTKSDSTQLYFNQGLSFYFSYHFREALASFREAARQDTGCAMAYWGQALAMGPYYNTYRYRMGIAVPATVEAMHLHNRPGLPESEAAMLNAMEKRYSKDTTDTDRPQLDSTYAAEMRKLLSRFPEDADMKALYIDAVMLRHKWDFWTTDGKPRPWTSELIAFCGEILKHEKLHPAGLHYLIHLTEASQNPGQALPSADLLKDAMPGVGHMVHMSTHMYQRNGLFEKGVEVNEDAVRAGNRLDSLAPNLKLGRNNIVHVFDVQSFCAMNAGMYLKGMPLYRRARERQLALQPNLTGDSHGQAIYMIPVLASVRLGKWKSIMREPVPTAGWQFASALDAFAKGLAFVHEGNLSDAKSKLSLMQLTARQKFMQSRQLPYNSPADCIKIAEGILKGEILFAEGKKEQAIHSFETAVDADDRLIYREPAEWLIPARQYLGEFLLKAGKFKEAERVYDRDLFLNPGNGWSLLGKYNSLAMQHKPQKAAPYRLKAEQAFLASDLKPQRSVY